MKVSKKVQRFFSVLLTAALLVTTMPMSILPANAATTEFAGGSGTEADPYLIETKEQLNNVRNHLDAHYKMIADIVFTEEDFTDGGYFYNSSRGWNPIGDGDNSFSGVFDGNGHSIKNLYAKNVGKKLVGLFGYNEGIIKNLSLIDADIHALGQVGGFIHSTSVYVGAIAGYSSGSIFNCCSFGSVHGEAENAGSVSTTHFQASIYVGGIVGYIGNLGTVINCYNNSSITAYNPFQPNPRTGGIAGGASGAITTSYNVGEISSGISGGIAGELSTLSTTANITNCYYLDNISKGVGSGTDACTKCSFASMAQKDTFVAFDFTNIWEFDSSYGYLWPILKNGYVPILNNTIDFAGGGGTELNPYLIKTTAHLNNVRKYLDAHYKMIADIVFTEEDFAQGGAFYNEGKGWDPIGNNDAAFSGTFDGNGHYIQNMHIDIVTLDRVKTYAGLFGLSYGSIKCVGVIDATINVQVKRSSSVSNEYCYTNVGGIAGSLSVFNSIEECYFSGKIELVEQSYNSSVRLGGIVGSSSGTVINCYNIGSIQSGRYDGMLGGVVGYNYGKIINCYNAGNVSGSSYARVGGITGYDSDEKITNCYYVNRNYRGASNNGNLGTSCSIDAMQNASTYNGFDFDNIWTIDIESDYPLPTLQTVKHEMSDKVNAEFAGGTGYLWDPFIVKTAEQLNNVRNNLDAAYALGCDISFDESDFSEGGAFYNEGMGWKPIGNAAAPFTGTFDGKGYNISGLRINSGVKTHIYLGLFGSANCSGLNTIRNINVVNCNITAIEVSTTSSSSTPEAYVGAVVGYGSVENCSASGEINISCSSACYIYAGGITGDGSAKLCSNSCNISVLLPGSDYASVYLGGIAGYSYKLSQCNNTGAINVNSSNRRPAYVVAGGIAGRASKVELCSNQGQVSGNGHSAESMYIGGICGSGTSSSSTNINQCYNLGYITGSSEKYTGGIVGYLWEDSSISNAFNAGVVSGGLNGGVIGFAPDTATITNCYNIGYINNGYGISYKGGIISQCYCLAEASLESDTTITRSKEEMLSQETFEGFDFDEVWQIGNNDQYPWPELRASSVKFNLINIADCVISLTQSKVHYHDVQPGFTVTYNGELLVLDEDYIAFFTVGDRSWRVETSVRKYIRDVGVGKLIIIGRGDFCCTTVYEFAIEKYDMANASLRTELVSDGAGGVSSSIFSLQDFVYDGTEKVQSGYRVCDTCGTIENVNFEITYKNNIEAGLATMIITGVGDYYTGILEKEFTIYAPSIESITITQKPNKLTYVEGESFDSTGMVVTAYYNNNTSGVVTDYTVSGYSSTVGTKTITVTYEGKTASFTVTVNSRVPSSITSSKYTVSGGNISKITAGTTVSALLSGINEGSYCKVYKDNSEVSGSTAVGTGMVVKIMDGNTEKASYTVIVTGDTNGDGNITVTDMIAIKAHVLKKTLLSGAAATAADTNGDGGISITDFIQVKAKILGKGGITAR